MWTVVVGLLIVTTIVTGVVAYKVKGTTKATIAEAMSILSAAFSIVILVFVVVPRFKEVYIGFGVELSLPTIWVIKVVDLLNTHPFFFLFDLFGSGLLGALLFHSAHRQPDSQDAARAWARLTTILLTVSMTLCLAAILLPMPKLLTDLA